MHILYIKVKDSNGNLWIAQPEITFNGGKQSTEFIQYFKFGETKNNDEDVVFVPNKNTIALKIDDKNYYLVDQDMRDVNINSISYNDNKQLSQIIESSGDKTKTIDIIYDSQYRL